MIIDQDAEALDNRMLMTRWLRLIRSIQAVAAPGGRAMCAFNAQELAETLAIHLEESEDSASCSHDA